MAFSSARERRAVCSGAEYRVYVVGTDGHFLRSDEFVAANDDAGGMNACAANGAFELLSYVDDAAGFFVFFTHHPQV